MHYQDCKRKAPSTTSTCILVPKFRRGAVGSMLHKWTVVMENTHSTDDTCLSRKMESSILRIQGMLCKFYMIQWDQNSCIMFIKMVE
jgi:hypothetical protein